MTENLDTEPYSYSFDEYDLEIINEQKDWVKSIEDSASVQEASYIAKKDQNIKILPFAISAISSLYFFLFNKIDQDSVFLLVKSYQNINTIKFYILIVTIILFIFAFLYIYRYLKVFNKVYVSKVYKYPSKSQIFPNDDINLSEGKKKYYRDSSYYLKLEISLRYDLVRERIELNNENEKYIDTMTLSFTKFIIFSVLSILFLYSGVFMSNKNKQNVVEPKATKAPPPKSSEPPRPDLSKCEPIRKSVDGGNAKKK